MLFLYLYACVQASSVVLRRVENWSSYVLSYIRRCINR